MDFEGTNTFMGLNGPRFEFISLVGMDYEDQIGYRFTSVHKKDLVIMQDCIEVNEQSF